MKYVCGERTVTELDYGYTCDSCKKEIGDIGDWQEMLHWEKRGGYASVFGDGTEMTLDLCQDCIKTFIQFHGNAYFPESDDPIINANLDTEDCKSAR